MRELVRGMCSDWAVSIRTACGAIGFDRSTFHYQSRRTDQAAVAKRIREICETRVRYGCRRVHVLLDREGWGINIKKVYRIYRELGMQLRNKTPKRRVKAKLREDRAEAVGPNDVWAMDFVHDQLATGRKLRVLTVVDTFSRLTFRCWTRALATVARMWLRRSIVCAGRSAIRKPSAWIRAPSSCPETWISGPISAALSWTSHARENRPTTPSSRHSMVGSERNA
jgi:putative transposase